MAQNSLEDLTAAPDCLVTTLSKLSGGHSAALLGLSPPGHGNHGQDAEPLKRGPTNVSQEWASAMLHGEGTGAEEPPRSSAAEGGSGSGAGVLGVGQSAAISTQKRSRAAEQDKRGVGQPDKRDGGWSETRMGEELRRQEGGEGDTHAHKNQSKGKTRG